MSRLARLCVVFGLALGLPVSVAAQETVEYYGTDAIGSVRIVFDASGNIVGRTDYAPFGEQLSASTVGHKSYAGLFRDGEAGLDYAEARSYQVRTGRFNAPDPVYAGLFEPQAWNRYGYALNNPLSFVDPTGLVADSCTTTETWSQDGDNWILNTTLKCKDNNGGGGGGSWADFLSWIHSTWGDSSIYGTSGGTDVYATSGGGGSGVGGSGCIFSAEVCSKAQKIDSELGEVKVAVSPQGAVAAALITAAVAAGRVVPAAGQRAAVLGTRIHTAFRNGVEALNLPRVQTEVSYLLGNIEKWGKPGSIRLDAVQYGSNGQILRIFDLKTGNAGMSFQRMEQIYLNLPRGQRPPITIIRP